MRLRLLPERLKAQRHRRFLKVVPLAVRRKLWFQQDGAPTPLWGSSPAVVERDISRNGEWTSVAFFLLLIY
jgi:hypothetical protein